MKAYASSGKKKSHHLQKTKKSGCRENCSMKVLFMSIYLHAVGNFLAVRQDLRQVLGTQDVPQGGLRQKPGGGVRVGDVRHGQDSVLHPVVHHAVDADRHGIFGQHLEESRTAGRLRVRNLLQVREDV